jgi:hypothetical protein
MNDYRNNEWTRTGPNSPDSATPTEPIGQPPNQPASYPPTQHPVQTPGHQQAQPGLARPLPGRRVSRHSSSRHSSGGSGSSRRKLRRMKFLVGVLLGVLVAFAVAGVMTFFKMQQFRGEAQQLTVDLREAEADLARAREKIAEMNNDMRILLANRIPGVAELSMNRQLEINDQYVRNITFVQPGTGENKAIEFSTVLENSRTAPTLPAVNIVLFDESGLQTGAVRLTKEQAITPVDIAELQPGETRTYSGRIPLQRDAPSKYFVVDVN